MTISLQFVHVGTASDGQPAALSTVDQRAIRSQAMKDFRRRQREAAKASLKPSTLSSASTPIQHHTPVPDGSTHDITIPAQDSKGLQFPTPFCIICGAHRDTGSWHGWLGHHCKDCMPKKHALSQRATPDLLPQTIRSPASIRGPMLQSHIEAFFPPCIWSNPRMIGVLSTWSIARSPATLHINDAIGLIHFGFIGKNQQLLMEGRKLHIKAVSSLRREINDPAMPIEIRASAVISMMMAEMYSATSSGLTGCATHLAGTTALLHTHLSQPNARPVDGGVLRQYNRIILIQGLIHRKAIPLDVRLTKYEELFAPGSIEALMYLGLRLPALTEATDRRYDKRRFSQDDNAIPEASSLSQELDTWLRDYETDGFRYQKLPLQFRSPVDANVLGLYWSIRLLLAECLYVCNSTGASTTTKHHRAAQLAKSEASMYADLLRETAVVIRELDGAPISKATSIRAPLHFAKLWWIRLGDERKVHAIEVMEHRLQLELPGIEWIALLYWSFMAASWLERV